MLQEMKVLVVEDDENYRYEISQELETKLPATHFLYAANASEARRLVETASPDLVMLDIIFPRSEEGSQVDYLAGVRCVEWLVERGFSGGILILSSQDKTFAVDLLVRFRQVRDYIFKDCSWIEILSKVRRHLEDLRRQKQLLLSMHQSHPLIGDSEAMQKIRGMALRLAQLDQSVMILGESGVGKEVLARSIHQQSQRSSHAFVPVNCAAIPEGLFESHFFGHRKGAFTSAVADQSGSIAAAEGGTLFLDEIGELPLAMQAKLLRVLQEKSYQMVGDQKQMSANVRILAATNVDLEKAVREKTFREDLYYRLNVVQIELPPLRQRPEDIEALVRHFLSLCQSGSTKVRTISAEALPLFRQWHWPGNVRELRNMVERLLALTDSNPISSEDVSLLLPSSQQASQVQVLFPEDSTDYHQLKQLVTDAFHRRFFSAQLRLHGGSIKKTAEVTGYNRNDLAQIVKKLNLRSDGGGEG